MVKYMTADVRRITRKKTRAIYFAVVLALTFASGFIFKHFNVESDLVRGLLPSLLASITATIIGLPLLNALFADDFKYKTFQQVVGRGVSRSHIVIAKFIEAIFLILLYNVLMFVAGYFSLKLNGYGLNASETEMFIQSTIKSAILTLGYVSLTMMVVYFCSNITFGIVVYMMLSLGVGETLISTLGLIDSVHQLVGDPGMYTFTRLLEDSFSSVVSGQFTFKIIPVVAYIIVPIIISTFVFKSKELDF